MPTHIANAFIPRLEKNNVEKPVILFVDDHSTLITLQKSEVCNESQVILLFLPPNTTHILQPVDVGAFKPFKSFWKYGVHKFQKENRKEDMLLLLLVMC